ncbi:MAG: hypothetical protein ABL949_01375 [Fimbriimonadaceae bacterium]
MSEVHATSESGASGDFSGKWPRKWLFASITIGMAICCCSPVYVVFIACPGSEELLQAGRQIKVGMPITQVRALIPTCEDIPDKSIPGRGKLYELAETSMQCYCLLEVEYSANKVTKVELTKRNDLTHASDVLR